MEQTKHIRLSGHGGAFALTPGANARLLRYLDNARMALRADPDGDETVRDLEFAIGEYLQQANGATRQPVDEAQLATELTRIGAVEMHQSATGPLPDVHPQTRPWGRIDEGKWFGGICLGIAARGNHRVDWVRTVVFFLLLLTAGGLGFVYLLLILIMPRYATLDEYERQCAGA